MATMEEILKEFQASDKQGGSQQAASDPGAAVGTKPAKSVLEQDLFPTMDSGSDIDVMQLMQQMAPAKDPATGNNMPAFANGLTPDQAINESPLTVSQRWNMSLGDEKGRMEFLANNFESAETNADGNVVVRKDGKYFQVDPKNWDSLNPLELTKRLLANPKEVISESLGDLADVAPEVAQLTASGLLAYATGGTSLLAQAIAQGGLAAGTATVRTSLGRMAGTYVASAEEQLKDTALEALLNMGGAVIAPAVALGGRGMAAAIKGTANLMSKAAPGAVEMLANTIGTFTRQGATKAGIMLEEGPAVAARMQSALGNSGTEDDAVKLIEGRKFEQFKKIASDARSGLTKWFGQGMEDIKNGLTGQQKANLSVNFRETAEASLDDLVEKGLAEKTSEGYKLAGPEARTLALKNSKKVPSELLTAVHSDAQAATVMETYINELNTIRQYPKLVGDDLIDALQKIESRMSRINNTAKQRLYKADLPGVAKEIGGIGDWFNLNFSADAQAAFKTVPNGSQIYQNFVALRSNYAAKAKSMRPLLDVQSQMDAGNDDAGKTYMTQLLAGHKRQYGKGEAINNAIEEVGAIVPGLQDAYKELILQDTAQAFIHKVQRGLVSNLGAGLGVGMSLATGNPVPAGVAAASAAVTSPRLGGAILRGAGSVMNAATENPILQTANAVLQKGRQWILTRPREQIQMLLQNEDAMRGFTQAMVNTPIAQAKAKQMFDQQIMSTMQGQGR